MDKADEKKIKSEINGMDKIDWKIIPIIKRITNFMSG